MFTINIGCAVVNEFSRIQIFTSVKDQNAIFFKDFQYLSKEYIYIFFVVFVYLTNLPFLASIAKLFHVS